MPVTDVVVCDHSFVWHGVVPPTHCPKCGADLRSPAYVPCDACGTVGPVGPHYCPGKPYPQRHPWEWRPNPGPGWPGPNRIWC